mgnify:CR=1 FL=1
MIKLGIVMDPIANINIKKDSSFAMLLEAQRRGYELHYMEMGDLYLINGEARAHTRTLNVKQNYEEWFSFVGEQDLPLQVAEMHGIVIGQGQRPDARSGKIERRRGAQPAKADNQHPAG